MKKTIYIATSNAHKLSEFSEMFAAEGIDCAVLGARDLQNFAPPVENGKTFAENALIKASALKAIAPEYAYVFADDSGIVVDALNGAPGIFSARYAGADGPDADKLNNEKLLRELENIPDPKRTARFVCSIALIIPSGEKKFFEGKIEGVINHGECGSNGFGYDPLFYIPELGMTTAELDSAQKNAISHRGKAFKQLAEFIKRQP